MLNVLTLSTLLATSPAALLDSSFKNIDTKVVVLRANDITSLDMFSPVSSCQVKNKGNTSDNGKLAYSLIYDRSFTEYTEYDFIPNEPSGIIINTLEGDRIIYRQHVMNPVVVFEKDSGETKVYSAASPGRFYGGSVLESGPLTPDIEDRICRATTRGSYDRTVNEMMTLQAIKQNVTYMQATGRQITCYKKAVAIAFNTTTGELVNQNIIQEPFKCP
jgi:hypothetical protein